MGTNDYVYYTFVPVKHNKVKDGFHLHFGNNFILNQIIQSAKLNIKVFEQKTNALDGDVSKCGVNCQKENVLELMKSVRCLFEMFNKFKKLKHDGLSSYIDISFNHHNHMIKIVEARRGGFDTSLHDFLQSDPNPLFCKEIAHQLIEAVNYLHKNGIVIGNLSDHSVMYDITTRKIKLVGYGLYSFTVVLGNHYEFNMLRDLSFLSPKPYLSNSKIVDSLNGFIAVEKQEDIWSLGLLIYNIFSRVQIPRFYNKFPFHLGLKHDIASWWVDALMFINEMDNKVSSSLGSLGNRNFMSTKFWTGIKEQLDVFSLDANEDWKIVVHILLKDSIGYNDLFQLDSILEIPFFKNTLYERKFSGEISRKDEFDEVCIYEIWKHFMKTHASTHFGKFVLVGIESYLYRNVEIVHLKDFINLFYSEKRIQDSSIIKEFLSIERCIVLLRECGTDESSFIKKELVDHVRRSGIPNFLRAKVWKVLLECEPKILETRKYDVQDRAIYRDFVLSKSIVHQIDLDIPRCYPNHPFISSDLGNRILKEVLNIYLVDHNKEFKYWQGMDSIVAVFIDIYGDDKETISRCLNSFSDKILKSLFMGREEHEEEDNNIFSLKKILETFRSLIAFHDPALSNHLEKMMFYPEYYAIPWFLTLFSHSNPLENVYKIWDQIMVEGPEFVFFISLGLLFQYKDKLLGCDEIDKNNGFNEIITLFVRIFDNIDICSLLKMSRTLYEDTPSSLYADPIFHGGKNIMTLETPSIKKISFEKGHSPLLPLQIGRDDYHKIQEKSLFMHFYAKKSVEETFHLSKGHLRRSVFVDLENPMREEEYEEINCIILVRSVKFVIIVLGDEMPGSMIVNAFQKMVWKGLFRICIMKREMHGDIEEHICDCILEQKHINLRVCKHLRR